MLCTRGGLPQPALLEGVPALPVTRTGKLDRRAAAEMCGQLMWPHDTDFHPTTRAAPPDPARSGGNAHNSSEGSAAPRAAHRLERSASGRNSEEGKSTSVPSTPTSSRVHGHSPRVDKRRRTRRRVSESDALRACAQVLHAVLQHSQTVLEPCIDILALGATSMHVAAIAALLDAQPAQVYRDSTPRGIARELSRSAGNTLQPPDPASAAHATCAAASKPAAGARQVTISRIEVAQNMGAAVHAACASHQTLGSAEQTSNVRIPDGCVASCTAEQTGRLMGQTRCDSPALELTASDSRGEGLRVLVSVYCTPQPPAGALAAGAPACGIQAPTQAVRLASMRACVDAPITLLEYACKRCYGGCERDACWAVVCSHAGDIACVHVPSGVRAWTTQLESSPDAGGQVTACGRYFVVAVLSGELVLLSIGSGARLTSLGTGGQLRRCAALCRARRDCSDVLTSVCAFCTQSESVSLCRPR